MPQAPPPPPRSHSTLGLPDVELGYELLGERAGATPVVAVNGGPGLSHGYMLMNDVWERVARRRLVAFYDQRGTGASKRVRPGAAQDMAAQVADLDALLDHLGLETAALLGDSYGGMLAMSYAAAHPGRIAKLVLSNSGPPSWTDMVHLFPDVFPDVKAEVAAKLERLGPDTDAAKRLKMHDHFRMLFHSPEHRDAYLEAMGELDFEPAVSEAVMAAIADIDLNPLLPRFAFPTLVMIGRYDMNVAPLTSWRMAEKIPGSQVIFFERSGHLPAFEEPNAYVAALEAFLDAPCAPAAPAA